MGIRRKSWAFMPGIEAKRALGVCGAYSRAVYRQRVASYTDFWQAYSILLPPTRHRPVGNEDGKNEQV